MSEEPTTPQLDYEQLPRPRTLAIDEGNELTIVRVPPTALGKLIRFLLVVGGFASFAIYVSLIGTAELVKGRAHWGEWGRVLFIAIVFALAALFVPTLVRQMRSWIAIEVSAARLTISLYDRLVWVRNGYDRDEIKSVRVIVGPRQWNFRRPRLLRIQLTDEAVEILHEMPMADLDRIARAIRTRMRLDDAPSA